MVPSTLFKVKVTTVPFGPLINLMASSRRIPTMLTASSSSSCFTFKISSPTSNSLARHAGPPLISSTTEMASRFLDSRAPIPSKFPEIV